MTGLLFGRFFTVLLLVIIAYFIIGSFFGLESAPRCSEYICYREY